MATATQTIANQQNAQASTGPRTPEGKAVVAQNATRHGFSSSRTVVLPHEDQTAYDELVAGFVADYVPECQHERFLVEQLAASRWRLDRVRRLEALAYDQLLFENALDADDPDAKIVAALSQVGNVIDKLQRYAAQHERAYYKAHSELRAHRKHLQKAEVTALDTYLRALLNVPTPSKAKELRQNLTSMSHAPKASAAPASDADSLDDRAFVESLLQQVSAPSRPTRESLGNLALRL